MRACFGHGVERSAQKLQKIECIMAGNKRCESELLPTA